MNNLILSCEHAGNEVPDTYKALFAGAEDILNSHRGWDPGALDVAQFLAEKFNAPLFKMLTTRLLVEMNRSLDSPELFSEFSSALNEADKEYILHEFYYPYRSSVEKEITKKAKPVLHVSIHSFTPFFNGTQRDVDIGLLFDPARSGEVQFATQLLEVLKKLLPCLNSVFNKPYRGTDDGLTTYLRKKFPNQVYRGIEIEINQKHVGTSAFAEIQTALYKGLSEFNLSGDLPV